jgi:hypothetical protein
VLRERRLSTWCWRAGRTGLLVAASLALLGGLLAAMADRALSDSVVLGSFAAALVSLPLCVVGLPAATQLPDPQELRS